MGRLIVIGLWTSGLRYPASIGCSLPSPARTILDLAALNRRAVQTVPLPEVRIGREGFKRSSGDVMRHKERVASRLHTEANVSNFSEGDETRTKPVHHLEIETRRTNVAPPLAGGVTVVVAESERFVL